MPINKTLCELKSDGFIEKDFKAYRKLVRQARFVCRRCGRAARRKSNLCYPKRLYPKS
jgi:hypothetical protein